jgi:hypothetical protein
LGAVHAGLVSDDNPFGMDPDDEFGQDDVLVQSARVVVTNSAIRVVGRLDPAEARRDEYGFLPAVQRQRATILKPGSMYLAQPRLPVPLLVEFPFPAWATRSSEAGAGPRPDDPQGEGHANGHGEVASDPFAGLLS